VCIDGIDVLLTAGHSDRLELCNEYEERRSNAGRTKQVEHIITDSQSDLKIKLRPRALTPSGVTRVGVTRGGGRQLIVSSYFSLKKMMTFLVIALWKKVMRFF